MFIIKKIFNKDQSITFIKLSVEKDNWDATRPLNVESFGTEIVYRSNIEAERDAKYNELIAENEIKEKSNKGQLSLLISTFNDIVISYADSAGYNLTGVEALKNHIRENQIILFKAQLALKLIKPNAVISEVYTNAMISILAEMKTNLTPLYDSLAELLGIVEVIEPADLIAEWDKLHIAIHN